MHAIVQWARANPGLMAAVVWPFVLAVITAAVKPRSPEAYERLAKHSPVWFFTRLAAFLQLLGALGIDPVKVVLALSKVVMGVAWEAETIRKNSAAPRHLPPEDGGFA
jgi:hypothetical protein